MATASQKMMLTKFLEPQMSFRKGDRRSYVALPPNSHSTLSYEALMRGAFMPAPTMLDPVKKIPHAAPVKTTSSPCMQNRRLQTALVA